MIAIVLTIVLFLAKSDPIAITAVFDDPYACGAKEQKVIGFQIVSDCRRVKESNKV